MVMDRNDLGMMTQYYNTKFLYIQHLIVDLWILSENDKW